VWVSWGKQNLMEGLAGGNEKARGDTRPLCTAAAAAPAPALARFGGSRHVRSPVRCGWHARRGLTLGNQALADTSALGAAAGCDVHDVGGGHLKGRVRRVSVYEEAPGFRIVVTARKHAGTGFSRHPLEGERGFEKGWSRSAVG
jgi:hypothetical protein